MTSIVNDTFKRNYFVYMDNERSMPVNNAEKKTTKQHLSSEGTTADNDDTGPHIAWLMSFPNSGTSFTLRVVHTVSNTSIATNYGAEDGNSINVPVRDDYHNGPFLHRLSKGLPSKYILTKTHCTGYCTTACPPEKHTLTSFLEGCCTGSQRIIRKSGRSRKEYGAYDPRIVKKAIHLIRNPFDNIVSRFHLQHNKYSKDEDAAWLEKHPRDKYGFQTWCKGVDALFKTKSDAAKYVPCHSEFFRYVQWHNKAIEVIRHLGIPVLMVHYDDYHDNYNGTMWKILDFLELPAVVKKPSFFWNDYGKYFSKRQKSAVKVWINELASEETMELLSKYVS
eukprot:CAMPEP_0172510050 /NCGR_PEP_ID=MMETSP1066-20121228/225714_1 /TAXON_ID=671091 /ORGANISM="Coscinodiscus wailesii, Strain CCMP2513" /LENGTH=335 /DNA_ID=CAMNT_0013288847 /DNA_START=265 /DNA_END=1272 /DNA_ORIENTATION=-